MSDDKPPTSIKVLGKRYSIRVVKNCKHLGTSNSQNAELEVLEDQDWQQKRDTVLHEIVHAIDYSMAMGLKERQVHALGCALYQLITENKPLIQWLYKGPTK